MALHYFGHQLTCPWKSGTVERKVAMNCLFELSWSQYEPNRHVVCAHALDWVTDPLSCVTNRIANTQLAIVGL